MDNLSSTQTKATLEDRFWKVEQDLMQVVRRLYALEAFVKELDRVTRGKPFRIWNDIIWMMLLDTRDMLVIHLASWMKGIYGKGGLLSQIKAHHVRELPRRRRPTARSERDQHLAALQDGAHQAAFSRLFPKGSGNHASPSDLKDLTAQLKNDTAGIVSDRHWNRAHVFDPQRPGSAKMLDLTELRSVATVAERLLNDLRLVGCASTMGHRDMNDANSATAAEEFVDSILIGHQFRKEVVMGGRDRDSFYEALHSMHDGLPPERQVMFNDNYDT
jgi:hypothetical protein